MRTSDVARKLGVHANTIRNYESWGFLPAIPRADNGYRAYSAVHLEQARLAILALQWPYLGERRPLVMMVQHAARQDFHAALTMADEYLSRIRAAQSAAEAAVRILEQWAEGDGTEDSSPTLNIGEAAAYLNVTTDMLRNWERNGLIDIPRQPTNQYRQYGATEFARLRVIHRLIQSGFSLMAIRKALQRVDGGSTSDLRSALTLPPDERANEAIDVMGDHWLPSLLEMEQRARTIVEQTTYLMHLVYGQETARAADC